MHKARRSKTPGRRGGIDGRKLGEDLRRADPARGRRGACRRSGVLLLPHAPAHAADPIKVGFSMALTGGVAQNGKQLLIALQIWRDDVNAKGGLLGRPVELVYYDDQSNPSNVPGIYTKLINVDKVDLLLGPYATNMVAAGDAGDHAEQQDHDQHPRRSA